VAAVGHRRRVGRWISVGDGDDEVNIQVVGDQWQR
jgi:hypothetical protein